jgi:hypothetical protein
MQWNGSFSNSWSSVCNKLQILHERAGIGVEAVDG